MMRKQLIVLTLVLMMLLALCCGAAQADGTQQIMLGGDVLTKGAHFVMAGTNWDVLRNSTNTDDTAGRLAISSDVKNRTGKKSWAQQMKYIDSFYESEFSAGEKEAVMYTNKSGSNNDKLVGAKLFALSKGEARSYFSTTKDRRPGLWWLRTKTTSSNEGACYVALSGDVGAAEITSMKFGVRPAFNLDLSKVLFASATDGGKSIAVEEGVVYSIPAAGGNEWKLTLLDESRNGFASSATALTGLSGGAVMIPYSGAQTGSNEYVSILLCDSAGEVKGYGSCPVSGADGTACFVLPSGLPAGSYTVKLFNEQKNESMKSDLAGAPETLTLTVCAFEGTGQPDDPYLLKTGGDWDDLAAYVAGGVRTEGLCFRLNASISTSAMLGTQANPFAGTFDGGGKTLTVNLEDSENITAPFRYIHNATIKNLRAMGSISVSDKRASGLIGENSGTSTVTNCRVSATLSGGNLIGGFSIGTGKKLSITGCVFDGKITGEPNQSGCFVAWGTSGLTITDCMADPQNGTAFTGGTFCHEGSAPTLTNCYYTTAVATAQGKQAFSVKGDNGVTIDFGTPSATYSVSGITAYPTGLKYGSDSTFYAGEGDNVAMNPVADPWEGHATSFTASAGTMTVSGSGWTLTMSSDNTVISVLRTPTFATTPVMHLTFDSGTGGYNNQGPEKLFDGLDDTKWCTAFNANGWYVEFHTDVPIKPTAYSMTTGGDTKRYPGRNPYSWQLLGRRNTEDAWTSLTVESNNDHLPPENCVEVFFPLNTEGGYRYYRLEVTAGAQNGSTLQLAEFKLIGTPTFGTPDFTLPAAITTVEEEAFLSAGMSVVLVPDSCTSISDHAFKDCAALTQIHIPAACTLGTDVFDGCTLVYVFGTSGSPAETYCQEHENCVFVKE